MAEQPELSKLVSLEIAHLHGRIYLDPRRTFEVMRHAPTAEDEPISLPGCPLPEAPLRECVVGLDLFDGMARIANGLATSAPPSLRRLALTGGDVDGAALARLLSAPTLQSIEQLTVHGLNGSHAALDLFDRWTLGGVEELLVHGSSLGPPGERGFGPDVARAFARSGAAARLKSLRSSMPLDEELATVLSGSLLTTLEARAGATPGGVSMLFNALGRGLRALELWSGSDAPLVARAIGLGPQLALSTLGMIAGPLGDGGARALAEAAGLTELLGLYLAGSEIGDAGARELAASPHLAQLDVVDVRQNALSPEVQRELALRWPEALVLC
jgi:hypothetical protein